MQALLGASRAVAFDLTAACSGFVLALVTGAQYIKTGTARNVLVIGADALSRYVDWRDRCAPSGAGQALWGLQIMALPRACPGVGTLGQCARGSYARMALLGRACISRAATVHLVHGRLQRNVADAGHLLTAALAFCIASHFLCDTVCLQPRASCSGTAAARCCCRCTTAPAVYWAPPCTATAMARSI